MAILKSRLFLKIMVSYVVLLLAVLVATYVYMAYRVHDNYIQLERQRLRQTRILRVWNASRGELDPILGVVALGLRPRGDLGHQLERRRDRL